MSLLPYLIGLPLLGAASLLILPKDKIESQKIVGFAASCLTLVLSLVVYVQFNTGSAKYQMVTSLPYVQEYGINGSLGIDGISLFLVLLGQLCTSTLHPGQIEVQEGILPQVKIPPDVVDCKAAV